MFLVWLLLLFFRLDLQNPKSISILARKTIRWFWRFFYDCNNNAPKPDWGVCQMQMYKGNMHTSQAFTSICTDNSYKWFIFGHTNAKILLTISGYSWKHVWYTNGEQDANQRTHAYFQTENQNAHKRFEKTAWIHSTAWQWFVCRFLTKHNYTNTNVGWWDGWWNGKPNGSLHSGKIFGEHSRC